MKKLFTFTMMALLVCAPSFAKDLFLGFYGGTTFITSDLGDYFDTGWNLTGFGEMMFTDVIGFRADLGYSTNDSSTDSFYIDSALNIVNFNLGLTYHFGRMNTFHGYVTGGGGFYSAEYDVDSYYYHMGDYSESDFGVDFGGGMLYPINQAMSLDLQGLAHFIFMDDTETAITLGAGLLFGI